MKSPRPASIASLALLFPAPLLQAPTPAPSPSAAQAQAPQAPAEVVSWLAHAAPLGSVEPEQGDYSALKAIVGSARMVAIGEASHGSHEFFAFKVRAFEYLVRELGFTDFAMETDWTTALAVNDYVEHGQGSLDEALRNLAQLWRTEEYRGLLTWMRAWNADPAHTQKLRFHGLDMGSPPLTAKRLHAYLERVDPDVAESVAPVIDALANGTRVQDADIDGMLALFDELREVFVERSSAAEWALHRQHVAILVQVYRQRNIGGNQAMSFRDRAMADNARWILRQDPHARIVLSAHDGHVSRAGLFEWPGHGVVESLGHALTQDVRTVKDEELSLVVIGAAFGRGGFWAYPAKGGVMATFRIDAPNPASWEAQLLPALPQLALLDLARAPADGPVRTWLTTPRLHVTPGGAWDPAWLTTEGQLKLTTLPAEYDALLFVPETTPAKRLDAQR